MTQIYNFLLRINKTFPDCSGICQKNNYKDLGYCYDIMIYFYDKETNLQSWHHTIMLNDYEAIDNKDKYFEYLFESFENVYDNSMEE